MKILLTGATGFIGSRLWKLLTERGHEVMGVSRTPPVGQDTGCIQRHVRYSMGDALPDGVVDFSPEILVHLAWDGIPDFSGKTCADNVENQIRFLSESEKLRHLRKVLVAGSCREYGDRNGLCHETTEGQADDYFSWAKQTLSEYFRLWCRRHEIGLLWFRVFYVYGPGQRSGSLVPTLISACRAGKRPEIRNPSAANDFVFIDDVLEAFVMGVENTESAGVLNLGSGLLTSVLEVAATVESQMNGEAAVRENGIYHAPSEKPRSGLVAEISQIRRVLGWEPRTPLSTGIDRILRDDH